MGLRDMAINHSCGVVLRGNCDIFVRVGLLNGVRDSGFLLRVVSRVRCSSRAVLVINLTVRTTRSHVKLNFIVVSRETSSRTVILVSSVTGSLVPLAERL